MGIAALTTFIIVWAAVSVALQRAVVSQFPLCGEPAVVLLVSFVTLYIGSVAGLLAGATVKHWEKEAFRDE